MPATTESEVKFNIEVKTKKRCDGIYVLTVTAPEKHEQKMYAHAPTQNEIRRFLNYLIERKW